MFTTSSWIDEELFAQAYPYLNLGAGYNVVLAKRTAIPVKAFAAQCTLAYSGGLNLLESFVIRAAATFSPTIEEFVDLTAVDLDIAEYLVESLIRVELICQNEDGALLLTDKGKEFYQRLLREDNIDKGIVGYQEFFTGQLQLLASENDFVNISDQDTQLLNINIEKILSLTIPSQEQLQETFLGMTDADPYFGYKLLSAQIQDSLEQKGIPVGVLLIHDVMTDSLHIKVFDLLRERFNPAFEQYYDPSHIAQVTDLVIEEENADFDDSYAEIYQNYLAEVEQARLGALEDIRKNFVYELVVDHRIKPRFLELIEEAKHEILLLSPWVRNFAMEALIEPLTNAAKRGVRVIIAWGIDTDITPGIREENRMWMQRFKHAKLPSGLPGVFFVWTGNHHRKEIIVDQRHYVIGSFNWLSYRGEKIGNLKIRGESALFIHLAQIAKEGREYFKELVAPALKRDWKYYLANLHAQQERNTCISVWVHLGMYEKALQAIQMLLGNSGDDHLALAEQAWELMEETLEANSSMTDPKELAGVLNEIAQMRQPAADVVKQNCNTST